MFNPVTIQSLRLFPEGLMQIIVIPIMVKHSWWMKSP